MYETGPSDVTKYKNKIAGVYGDFNFLWKQKMFSLK